MAKHARRAEQRHGFAYKPSRPDPDAPIKPLPDVYGLVGLAALSDASASVEERLSEVLRLAKYENVEDVEAVTLRVLQKVQRGEARDAIDAVEKSGDGPQLHAETIDAIHSFCDNVLKFPTIEASNIVGAYVGLRLNNQRVQTDDTDDAVAVALIQGGQPREQADRDMLVDVHSDLHGRGYHRKSIDRLERDGRLFAAVHVDHDDNLDTALTSGVPLSKQSISKACRPFYLAFGAPLKRGRKGYLVV